MERICFVLSGPVEIVNEPSLREVYYLDDRIVEGGKIPDSGMEATESKRPKLVNFPVNPNDLATQRVDLNNFNSILDSFEVRIGVTARPGRQSNCCHGDVCVVFGTLDILGPMMTYF